MSEKKQYLGVDYGGTFVKYGLVNTGAQILERGEIPAPLDSVDAFVDTLVGLYDAYSDRIEGVAVSMPGTIDCTTGEVITAGAYLKMPGHNLYKLVQGKIALPITVENDGKCGALSEVWTGALRDCQDGIVMVIGTGLAGGIIKNRKLHRGSHLTAGEFSALIVRSDQKSFSMCAGGMMKLTTQVVTALGLDVMKQPTLAFIQQVPELLSAYTMEPQCEPPEEDLLVDGVQIFKWVDEGHPIVVPIYQNFIRELAAVLYNVHVVYDPEVIAIGGGVSRQPRLIRDLDMEITRICNEMGGSSPFIRLPIKREDIRLEVCKNQNDANLIGAVYNYLSIYAPQEVGL